MTKRRPSTQSRAERLLSLTTVWPVCYSTLVVIVHSYLIYQAVSRYKIYATAAPGEAGYHLVLLCIAALLLPVIVLLSFVKTGTYTNDGAPFGDAFLKREISHDHRPQLRRFVLGAPPIAPILHVICAYLLLMPNVFTVARVPQLLPTADMDKPKNGFFDSPSLRIRLNTTSSSESYVTVPSTNFELSNLLLALVIYSYRSVAVFWKTCRLFTIIFWVQLLASISLHLLSFMGFRTLYAQMQYKDLYDGVFLLSETSLILLYITANTVLFLSSWCVLQFGYGAVLEKINSYLRQLKSDKRLEGECAVYLPHGLALLSILLYVGCNAPVMYDYVTMHSQTRDHILILHLISCVIYMLLWISLWFTFTIKQNWDFKINDIALRRYTILQNRDRFVESVGHHIEEVDSYNSSEILDGQDDIAAHSEDNISNSTTSTNNGFTPRSSNGILSHKAQSRQKRKCSEQKVKFQEATKIVIETNLDSDLDTIPESDTERADSAMFSGSGGSNDSNESQSTQVQNLNSSFHKVLKPTSDKELVLSPRNIRLLALEERNTKRQERMWSSTGDLNGSPRKYSSDYIENRPQSVISEQLTTNYSRVPYSPTNPSTHRNFVSNGHTQLFDDAGMSSAV